jgi:hypothetical protein
MTALFATTRFKVASTSASKSYSLRSADCCSLTPWNTKRRRSIIMRVVVIIMEERNRKRGVTVTQNIEDKYLYAFE